MDMKYATMEFGERQTCSILQKVRGFLIYTTASGPCRSITMTNYDK
jgi:hypothetical protein